MMRNQSVRIVVVTVALLFGTLSFTMGQTVGSFLVFRGKLDKVRRERMEFHDSCYDIRDYYSLVTHTYRIEEIFNGEYQDNHIDLCFRTEFADEDKSHYRNTLVVADLSKDNITWGAFPLFKTIRICQQF